jgi:hypothetical protein
VHGHLNRRLAAARKTNACRVIFNFRFFYFFPCADFAAGFNTRKSQDVTATLNNNQSTHHG